MGTMFGFGKKKKPSLPELPPPPSPPEFSMPEGDIPAIRPAQGPEEVPEIPTVEEREKKPAELPEAPVPELPEAPAVEEMPKPEEEHLVPETIKEPEPVEETIEELETVRRPIGPAFVAVDEYRAIMEHSNRVRSKLEEAGEFVRRLSEIKAEEEKTFEKWRSQLEEIERRLGQIDRFIAKAKG
ncbi:MAG: hypothetical protein QXT19_00335 [Candidatus Woesearchaeota archaeon]